MKDLRVSNIILRIKIIKDFERNNLSRAHYIEQVLKKFKQFEYSPTKTAYNPSIYLKKNKGPSISTLDYARVLGNHMYIMNYTIPDIVYAIGRLIKYTYNPSKKHWNALNKIMRYLKHMLRTHMICSHFISYSNVR